MSQLLPRSFSAEIVSTISSQQATPGTVQGVYIPIHTSLLNNMSERMQRWFADWPEVALVDVRAYDK